MLRRRASETLSYQREVVKGKLTAVASFEKLTIRAPSSEQRGSRSKGSRSKRQLFKTRYGG